MKTCLDEGTLQAYLDGELSPETLNAAATHLSACASCAEAARVAEQELSLLSVSFASTFPASVPTATLRARLDDAIAELNAAPRPSAVTPPARLRSLYASLIASLTTFTPRQATAFASFLVAVALLFVFFALMQSPEKQKLTGGEIARNERPSAPASRAAQIENSPAQVENSPAQIENSPALKESASLPEQSEGFDSPAPVRREERANFVKAGLNVRSQVKSTDEERAGTPKAPEADTVAARSEPVLEDEKTYINSIASLTSAIEAQGVAGLTPTLRAEYERNLAVVNQAIISSRVAARRNPQDTDAKEFLRAAYQNKVELLSAVADQAQIASSRD